MRIKYLFVVCNQVANHEPVFVGWEFNLPFEELKSIAYAEASNPACTSPAARMDFK